MELAFDVEDLVLGELAVTTVGEATFDGPVPASCSCCSGAEDPR